MDFETLKQTAFEPLYGHIGQGEQLENRAEWIALLTPATLYDLLKGGLNNAWWSVDENYPMTRSALHEWSSAALAHAGTFESLWGQAHERESGALIDGLKAGAFSEETQIGATIGSFIFPGIGTAVGAVLGGMVAGNKVDKQAQELFVNMLNAFDNWVEAANTIFDNTVGPAFNRDLHALQSAHTAATPEHDQGDIGESSSMKMVGFLGFAALAGVLLYYFVFADRGEVNEAIAAAEEVVEAPPLAHLDGIWESTNGQRFQVEKQGNRFALNSVDTDGAQHTEFMLTPVDEVSFTVRQNVLAEHVRDLPIDSSAEHSCRRLIGQVDGAPLSARLSNGTLLLDTASIELKNEHVRRRGGRIVECTDLGAAPLLLRELMLKPVQ